MDLLSLSLIYRMLVLHHTVCQANLVVDRLGLEHARITNTAQIVESVISPPMSSTREHRGFQGNVITSNLLFTITSNELILDQIKGPAQVQDWRDDDGQLGVPRDSVSDQMAYSLARGWLERLGMDVDGLERRWKPQVHHQKLPLTTRKIVSSRFTVKWGERQTSTATSPAEVSLNASQKWLVTLYITDLSFYRHPLPKIPHDVSINMLPNEPVRQFFHLQPGEPSSRILERAGFSFTNAFVLLESPAKYEEDGRRALLQESRRVLSILECDQLDNFEDQNLTTFYVYPPAFGWGGHLEYRDAEFRFDAGGKLQYFYFLPKEEAHLTNDLAWASIGNPIISTNKARQIATEKLAALSIDVQALNRDCRLILEQGKSFRYDKKGRRQLFDIPIYWMAWKSRTGGPDPTTARVAVYTDTERVGRIELKDTSYCKRRLESWGHQARTTVTH